ncbi:MAG: methyl-accepting chemotaxis protein [Desulfomonilaceae bacterium]
MVTLAPKSMLAKLVVLLVLISLVPTIVIGILAFETSRKSLEEATLEKLSLVTELKRAEIVRYFEALRGIALFLAQAGPVVAAFESSSAPAQPAPKTDKQALTAQNAEHSELNKLLSDFTTHFSPAGRSIDDVLLINANTGEIVSSVRPQDQRRPNVLKAPANEGGLSRLVAKVVQTSKPALVDFSHCTLTSSVLAFVGAPVVNSQGAVIGVVALAISPKRIDDIMAQTERMTKGTSFYLVGRDLLMRSQLPGETTPTILKKKMDFEATRAALRHESGTGIMPDEKGELSLISYSHVGLNENPLLGADFDWTIVGDAEAADVLASVTQLRHRIILIGGLLAIVAILVAYFSARAISNPLMGGVNVLASAATQISATVSQLASSSAQTLSAVNQTTATLEELRQSGQLSSEKARAVSEDSRKSLQVAHAGKQATDDIIRGMDLIKSQMQTIGDTVIKLSEQSRSIEDIIDAVKDLADQSNLLAVNASIEAARAGEQGKGFAVVADEIKSFADQSKKATVQVRTILEDIRNSISSVVMATEKGGKAVESGVSQSEEAGHAIQAVTTSVQEASQALTVIVASAEQQAVGIDQVASAMDSIDQAMRQNVDGTRQLESAAQNLKDLGQKLADLVQGR